MIRKRIVVLLLIISVFLLSGCSALFFDTYYSEKDFQGNQSIDLDSDIQMVRNYAELRRLVFNSMNNHEESMQLRFVGYTGNAVSDIASVCNAVKTESAYGAYCVDYVSYDITQIVSYYEASIHLSYTYSMEELALLQTTNNHDSFSELLTEASKNESSKIVVKVNNGSSDYTVVKALIEHTIRENPLSISYYPHFTVKIFSGNSSQKIYEVHIQYDDVMDNDGRIKELSEGVVVLLEGTSDESPVKKTADAALVLSKHCLFDAAAGETAYDALITQHADSEGISSAFKLLCDNIGVECMTVSGKLGREVHFWNIVKIEDAYYHVDVSLLQGSDEPHLFRDDAEQQMNYWWDQSVYPDCQGKKIVLKS